MQLVLLAASDRDQEDKSLDDCGEDCQPQYIPTNTDPRGSAVRSQ